MTISLVAIGLGTFFYFQRLRDFGQRSTIERQRAELTTLNAELEARVARQVAEIVARAEEVERLNKQLRASVQERSRELSFALARLSLQRSHSLEPGSLLGGRYEIQRLLGEGGVGAVYAARDRSTGSAVALKVIQASSARELDGLHRFLREAQTAAAVEHPAVVRMLHVDVSDDGVLFQAQELVEGTTLADRMRRGPLPMPLVARIGEVLCDALVAAHAAGVVHRDVKPANVMLTPREPGLKLLDFGIAKLYDAVSSGADLTATGRAVGTPAYMAPEQLAGVHELTDRVDVYAVGTLMFHALTGHLPFEDSAPTRRLLRRLTEEPPEAVSFSDEIDVELSALVAAAALLGSGP